MSDSQYISEVSENNFEAEVIERSYHTTVFVDFWAEWCNPCKILIPILTAMAEQQAGKFHLAKVNSDQERNLSAQFGIRSIPTVKIFKQGEIVDEFNGVLPEATITDYIEKHQFKEDDLLLQKAKEAFETNKNDAASELLKTILEKDATNIKAIAMLSRIHLHQGDVAAVDELLGHVTINKMDDPTIHEIHILNEFAREVVNGPGIDTMQSLLAENDDIEVRYKLACKYALLEQYESALEQFLEVMKKDRKYKDDGARKSMVSIFELLGSSGPLVTQFRMKISRLLH